MGGTAGTFSFFFFEKCAIIKKSKNQYLKYLQYIVTGKSYSCQDQLRRKGHPLTVVDY